MRMKRKRMKMQGYRLVFFPLQIYIKKKKIPKINSTFFLSCVQNEEDDWQENEELRAIEGLEGKSEAFQEYQQVL